MGDTGVSATMYMQERSSSCLHLSLLFVCIGRAKCCG
jgi:hypothetical protein